MQKSNLRISVIVLCAVIVGLGILKIIPQVHASKEDAEVISNRAKTYITNCSSGKWMNDKDWETRALRSAPQRAAFGGLSAMIDGMTKETQQKGGLKSVDVINVSKNSNGYATKLIITYNNNETSRETLFWEKEDGIWKISDGKGE
jgi:mannitol-specific phosphotransferase system IIBC component